MRSEHWRIIVFGAFSLVLAVLLLSGRGERLLWGFNLKLLKGERVTYTKKELARPLGILMLLVSVMIFLSPLIQRYEWAPWAFFALIVCAAVMLKRGLDKGGRFRK